MEKNSLKTSAVGCSLPSHVAIISGTVAASVCAVFFFVEGARVVGRVADLRSCSGNVKGPWGGADAEAWADAGDMDPTADDSTLSFFLEAALGALEFLPFPAVAVAVAVVAAVVDEAALCAPRFRDASTVVGVLVFLDPGRRSPACRAVPSSNCSATRAFIVSLDHSIRMIPSVSL